MDRQDDLVVVLLRDVEDVRIGVEQLQPAVLEDLGKGLVGRLERLRTAFARLVEPQVVVGLEHLYGAARGDGAVRRRGGHQFERRLDVLSYLTVNPPGIVAEGLQIGVARLETGQQQRRIAPDACDVVIDIGPHEIGVGQDEILVGLVGEGDSGHVFQDQVGVVDRRVARTPVGALGLAAVEDVVEHLLGRARAAGAVGERSGAVVAPVDQSRLENGAHLVIEPGHGASGVALVAPHVRGRDLALLLDVHVAQTRTRADGCGCEQQEVYEFAFHCVDCLKLVKRSAGHRTRCVGWAGSCSIRCLWSRLLRRWSTRPFRARCPSPR